LNMPVPFPPRTAPGSCTSTQASIFSGRLFLSRPEIFLNFFV
jgi:hypothetical protein